MKFSCKPCNYETNDKSNINRHLKSLAHDKIIRIQNHNKTALKKRSSAPPKSKSATNLVAEQQELELSDDKKFTCEYCNNSFSKLFNLQRHQKICKSRELNSKESRITKLENEIHEMKTFFMDYVKNNPSANALIPHSLNTNSHNTNSHNTTYNISVKNYVQRHYPNAPALMGMADYSRLTYDDNGKENKDEFVDTLVYEHKNSALHKYLGDFIVGYYKKENPSEQSMWTSDTSRLTYIIKELLFNKKSIWNHDYKGTKTKNYIVTPLLQHMKKYLDEYWIEHLKHFKTTNLDNLNKLDAIYRNIYDIKKNVDNGTLSNDIIRYMAPHFYMDKKNINGKDMVDYFIDSEEE